MIYSNYWTLWDIQTNEPYEIYKLMNYWTLWDIQSTETYEIFKLLKPMRYSNPTQGSA